MVAYQGIFDYSGLANFKNYVKSATFTLTPGGSPSVCTIVTVPLPSIPNTHGTLTISYGPTSFSFYNVLLNEISTSTGDNGTEWVLTFLDRRWLWHDRGQVSGEYNVHQQQLGTLHGISLPERNERTPWELLSMCFDELGEVGYDISLVPNDLRPEVRWEFTNPGDAINELCDILKCVVCLGPADNKIYVVPFNYTTVSFADADAVSFDTGVNPPDPPRFLAATIGRTSIQVDIPIIPYGRDTDGKFKPLHRLSFRPFPVTAPEWTALTSYSVGDKVKVTSRDERTYLCTTAHISDPSSFRVDLKSIKWVELTGFQGGEPRSWAVLNRNPSIAKLAGKYVWMTFAPDLSEMNEIIDKFIDPTAFAAQVYHNPASGSSFPAAGAINELFLKTGSNAGLYRWESSGWTPLWVSVKNVWDRFESIVLQSEQVESYVIEGEMHRKPAWVYGEWNHADDSGGHATNASSDRYYTGAHVVSLPGQPKGLFNGSVSMDTERSLVHLSDPLRILYYDESSKSKMWIPPRIYLRTAIQLRQMPDRKYLHFVRTKTIPTAPLSPANTRYESFADISHEVFYRAGEGVQPAVSGDNYAECIDATDQYLAMMERHYQRSDALSATYAGFKLAGNDGAVRQVTWSIGADGIAMTRISRSREERSISISYRERVFLQQTKAKNRQPSNKPSIRGSNNTTSI